MGANPNVAEIATLLSEPSRAAILTALMDGRYHTATELAFMSRIKQQTASFHLSKLESGKVIRREKSGRHHYFQLANKEIARILESFFAASKPPEIRSLHESMEAKQLKSARTCYDHLAGNLAVKLTQAMIHHDYVKESENDFVLTPEGESFLTHFGLNISALREKRRFFARKCLDWSERQHHLAGALGNGIFQRMLELQWVKPFDSNRAISITSIGKQGLLDTFDVTI